MTSSKGESAISLARIASNGKARIIRIEGGREMQSHLIGMGLMPGVEISVARNADRGPMIITINNNRLALGRGMLGRVMVVPLDAEAEK